MWQQLFPQQHNALAWTTSVLPEGAVRRPCTCAVARTPPCAELVCHSRSEHCCVCIHAQAFFYQVKLETEMDEPPATRLAQVSMADIIM